ncbi:MAG: lytic murein transglycosylase [Rhodobacteraceae bacterium HLUCCA08]|nr:MAG: lytic murein transglycosylase [Rhodobacteraceae bacterium HLUCCA08]
MKQTLVAFALLAAPAQAQTCGGPFPDFLDGIRAEARALGHDPAATERFLQGARIDDAVLRADREQGHFQRDFLDFSRRLISRNRLDNGAWHARQYAPTFDDIEARWGVDRGVLLAFWAFETDFGQVQGDFNTRDALLTLAHDCRRPDLFRPQVFAALTLYEQGDFDLDTTGAWAGEIGQVQMLPRDILENGIDGDGDGHVTLKTSTPDALMSGAAMLSSLGWRANEPWIVEIVVPATLDWAQTGLDQRKPVTEWQALGVTARHGTLPMPQAQTAVILPMGRDGPAFLAYPNFDVFFEWNQSFTYVLTAAYFATRLQGAPVYDAGNPDPGLSGEDIQRLQQRLTDLGHDVGGIDGILGAKTRAAVRAEQLRLGLPADAWPTRALLDRL